MAKSDDQQSEKRVSSRFPLKFIIPVVLVVLLVLGGLGYYYYTTHIENTASSQPNSPEQVKKVVDEVGKLMELPSGETPTVAVVSDVSKLRGQPFFVHAENGDQLLVYSNAKKAIIYRPSTNKIIEVGPVNITPPSPSPESSSASSSAQVSKQLKVVILNGTTTVGLTKIAEKKITDGNPAITVVNRDNATKQDYPKTLVIDLSGTKSTDAAKIASSINGQVSTLPSTEQKPARVDILIILGSDFIGK